MLFEEKLVTFFIFILVSLCIYRFKLLGYHMSIKSPIQEFIQLSVPLQASVVLLALIVIQQLRQRHIGRVSIAGAGVLVFGTAYPILNQLAGMWRLYTAVAVVFAIIAAFSYLTKTGLSTEFYQIALLLYGAGPIIMVFLYGFPL